MMKNAVRLTTALIMIILRPALTESAALSPNPWLTTKQTRVLDLRCTIPVHTALRDQWRYVDGIHITFQPFISYSRNISLASVTSADVPRRGEDLHPMAEVEGLVSVSELSDPRPHHLSVLTPFDLDAGDAGIYYCVVNYTDSARERHSLSYKINVDAKLVYESFDAADGCFAGKIATADEINVTWPLEERAVSHPSDPLVQRIITDKEGRKISDPRILVRAHQKGITYKSTDTYLAKLSSPENYIPGKSNYTLILYVAKETCYPNCTYTCDVGGQTCKGGSNSGEQSATSSAVTRYADCTVAWVLVGVLATLVVLLIILIVYQIKNSNKVNQCLKSMACSCLIGKHPPEYRKIAQHENPRGPNDPANPVADQAPVGHGQGADQQPPGYHGTDPHEAARGPNDPANPGMDHAPAGDGQGSAAGQALPDPRIREKNKPELVDSAGKGAVVKYEQLVVNMPGKKPTCKEEDMQGEAQGTNPAVSGSKDGAKRDAAPPETSAGNQRHSGTNGHRQNRDRNEQPESSPHFRRNEDYNIHKRRDLAESANDSSHYSDDSSSDDRRRSAAASQRHAGKRKARSIVTQSFSEGHALTAMMSRPMRGHPARFQPVTPSGNSPAVGKQQQQATKGQFGDRQTMADDESRPMLPLVEGPDYATASLSTRATRDADICRETNKS